MCTYCNKDGHTEDRCFKKKSKEKNKKPKGGGKGGNKGVKECSHCKKKGHTQDRCFQLHPELKGKNTVTKVSEASSVRDECLDILKGFEEKGQINRVSMIRTLPMKISGAPEHKSLDVIPIYSTTTKPHPIDDKIDTYMSFCDGMSGFAMSLVNASTRIDRYIAIEKESKARKFSLIANPKSERFPGVDHSR